MAFGIVVPWVRLRELSRLEAIYCRTSDRDFRELQVGDPSLPEEVRKLLVHKVTWGIVGY